MILARRKKTYSIEHRFIQALVLMVIAVQTVSVSVHLIQSRASFEKTMRTNAELTLGLLAKLIEAPLGEFNIPEVEQMMREVSKDKLLTYAKVYDSSGEIISSFGQFENSNLLVVKRDVLSTVRGGEKIGSIEIGLSKDNLESAFLSQLYLSLFSEITLGIAIMLTIRWLFRRFVSKPLSILSKFATEKANVEHLRSYQRDDEFGSLARVLFEMTNEIKNHTDRLEEQVKQRTSDLEQTNQSLHSTLEQLKKTQDELINNSKLAALGKLSASISHEINNPLAVIKASSDQLKIFDPKDNLETERFQKRVSTIRRMVDRISVIVHGMRTFSRADADQPFAKTNFKNLVQESLDLGQIRFKGTHVKLHCEEIPDVEVECRSIQISQVIINLLSNAYDAVEKLPDPWVKVSSRVIGDRIEIAVTDSGLGIPNDIAAKLMEPFFTTKEVGSGTGLGLSISFGIAKAHHGMFELDQNCKNTRFVLTLPISQSTHLQKVAN